MYDRENDLTDEADYLVNRRISDRRVVWLVTGLLVGLAISYFWPHEPLRANADRNEKFAMTTAMLGRGIEAVFVLDFLTGRLTGAVLNNQGDTIVYIYGRNVAKDFNQADADGAGNYAIVSGFSQRKARAGIQWGQSSIYIAELSSGKVICYGIPYQNLSRPARGPVELLPISNFSFRRAADN